MTELFNKFKLKIKGFLIRRNIKLDRKVLIFFLFVVISTIFWLLNTLSKNYTTTINYPVRYTNFPEEKVLVSKLPNYISIKVNAYGFTLLKYKYKLKTSFFPITFNVKSLGLRKNNATGQYYLLTRYEQSKISKQLSNELKVIEIYPDTIHFHLADIIKKKVPVKTNISYTLGKQTMLNGNIKLNPDSVIISGPQTIIDITDSVLTRFLDFNELTQKISRNIALESIEGIGFEQKRTIVTIPAEKFTEAKLKKRIEIANLPDSLLLKTFPKEIDISYQVALSNFERISEEDFILLADFNDSKDNLSNKLKLQLIQSPDIVKKVSYYPTYVEYIIEQND